MTTDGLITRLREAAAMGRLSDLDARELISTLESVEELLAGIVLTPVETWSHEQIAGLQDRARGIQRLLRPAGEGS